MIRTSKKLRLSRETVRQLHSAEMRRANGGTLQISDTGGSFTNVSDDTCTLYNTLQTLDCLRFSFMQTRC